MKKKKNIFCLEGEWENSLKSRHSILPTLEFLEHSYDVKHVFRKVAMKEDLYFYLRKALRAEFRSYPIINLAFHGSSQNIEMASGQNVTFGDIATEFQGRFEGKIIHFGSCSTLKASEDILQDFMEQTGALIVSGYTKTIDFIDSSLFDIAYFCWLQEYDRLGYVDERLAREYPGLYDRLGFTLLHQNKACTIR